MDRGLGKAGSLQEYIFLVIWTTELQKCDNNVTTNFGLVWIFNDQGLIVVVAALIEIKLPNDKISSPRLSQQHPVCSLAPPPNDISTRVCPHSWSCPVSSILLRCGLQLTNLMTPPSHVLHSWWGHVMSLKPQPPLNRGPKVARGCIITFHLLSTSSTWSSWYFQCNLMSVSLQIERFGIKSSFTSSRS